MLKKYLISTNIVLGITIATMQTIVNLKSLHTQEGCYDGSIYTYFTRDLGSSFEILTCTASISSSSS